MILNMHYRSRLPGLCVRTEKKAEKKVHFWPYRIRFYNQMKIDRVPHFALTVRRDDDKDEKMRDGWWIDDITVECWGAINKYSRIRIFSEGILLFRVEDL